MSEHESTFIIQLQEELKSFKEDIDKRYSRMQGFLISIIVVLIGSSIAVGFTHFTRDGETRTTVADNTKKIEYILDNAVSQKAISDILMTYDNNTKAMEKFLPDDIQGYVKATEEANRNMRSYIMMFQGGLNMRGATEDQTKGNGGGVDQ